jgi:stearoyl-CoA desaturase (delta-9 desaturase)
MSTTLTSPPQATRPNRSPKPLTEGHQGAGVMAVLWAFVSVPFLALLLAVPVAWGWGLSWLDVAMALTAYVICAAGIGVGFHRHLTHGSFKARRWLRILLTLAGSAAIEGGPIQWVADHRRHHAFTDREGDPHSPWRYGTGVWGLTRGLIHAHIGWMFRRETSNRSRFAPDLMADPDVRRIDRLFPVIIMFSVLLPAVVGGLATRSLAGAISGLFWAGLVRTPCCTT